MPNEESGGDRPCWAHLFEEDATDAQVAKLAEIACSESANGLSWSGESEDFNLNLLVFRAGEGVIEHQNHEVDVLLVGIAGEGVVTIDEQPHALRAGDVIVIPKGARRATRAAGTRFSYLTCHRRRGGLQPIVHPAKPAVAG